MARIRTKREQREFIPGEARKLAKSGNFLGWWDIEVHLRYDEHCWEARHVLDNERIREELNRLCSERRQSSP